MPARKLIVVKKQSAVRHCPQLVQAGVRVVYLCNDYAHLLAVQKACGETDRVAAQPELFHRIVDELRDPHLDFIAALNERNNTLAWWSGHLSSKNPSANTFFTDVVRFFCVLRLIEEGVEPFAVVLDNAALIAAVREETERRHCTVQIIAPPLLFVRHRLRQWTWVLLRFGYFIFLAVRLHWAARVCRPNILAAGERPRILLRSWIIESSFDKQGKYRDRLFGDFPQWLEKQGYEVLHYPQFLDIALVSGNLFNLMQGSGEKWVLIQRYLHLSDYIWAIANSWRILNAQLDGASLCGVNIEVLLRDAIRSQIFAFDLMFAHFGYPLLERLKERGIKLDRMFYPFEGNAHEKTFLLSARRNYPGVPVDGFHPTALYAEEYAYYLSKMEAHFHPLPDRLLCGGPIYLDAFARTGFPKDHLTLGANLRTRFQPLPAAHRMKEGEPTRVFIALSGVDRHQTIELLYKTTRALQPAERFQVYIRTHPVFTRAEIENMLAENGITNCTFADDGAMQDWLARSDLMVTQGCTMAVIEGVAMGVPVIRIRPENNLFYDPIAWTPYPFPPIFNVDGIRKTLAAIEEIRAADPEYFTREAVAARVAYFEPVSEAGLKRFLKTQ